jgi:hypothetical protein
MAMERLDFRARWTALLNQKVSPNSESPICAESNLNVSSVEWTGAQKSEGLVVSERGELFRLWGTNARPGGFHRIDTETEYEHLEESRVAADG